MRFKVGQKVRVVKPYSGSEFSDGDIVEIVRIGTEDGETMNCYGAVTSPAHYIWYLYEDEVAPLTNADKIRNMTDEELADFIQRVQIGDFSNLDYGKTFCDMCDRQYECDDCLKYWLKQPAEGE